MSIGVRCQIEWNIKECGPAGQGESVWHFQCRFANRALGFFTSLSKVAPGTITSPNGLIHPVISTGCPFLLCSCAHISSCTGVNYCDASSALQFVACLGWYPCQMVFRDNPWADPRACDQHTEPFLKSTVHVGREKNSLGTYGAHWQGHRGSSRSLPSNRPAGGWLTTVGLPRGRTEGHASRVLLTGD